MDWTIWNSNQTNFISRVQPPTGHWNPVGASKYFFASWLQVCDYFPPHYIYVHIYCLCFRVLNLGTHFNTTAHWSRTVYRSLPIVMGYLFVSQYLSFIATSVGLLCNSVVVRWVASHENVMSSHTFNVVLCKTGLEDSAQSWWCQTVYEHQIRQIKNILSRPWTFSRHTV